jgi:hypothetical protein
MSLLDQYRALHAQGKFLGLSVLKFADEIGALVKEHGIKTVLDYGSGQGYQYMPPHSLDKKWGVDVTMYDPAVPGLDELPGGKFDMVICSDVLEHVPEEEITPMIEGIYKLATKYVFFTVCCRAAKKTLPDGRNTHVTIRPMGWWANKIAEAGADTNIEASLLETP